MQNHLGHRLMVTARALHLVVQPEGYTGHLQVPRLLGMIRFDLGRLVATLLAELLASNRAGRLDRHHDHHVLHRAVGQLRGELREG